MAASMHKQKLQAQSILPKVDSQQKLESNSLLSARAWSMSAAKIGCTWSEKQRAAILASWTPERRARKSAERKNLVISSKMV